MPPQQQVGQASAAVEQLLRALWHSRILEEIMPQVSGLIYEASDGPYALV